MTSFPILLLLYFFLCRWSNSVFQIQTILFIKVQYLLFDFCCKKIKKNCKLDVERRFYHSVYCIVKKNINILIYNY